MRLRLILGVLVAGILVGSTTAAATTIDLAKNPQALRSVPMQYRPLWRWWWPVGTVDHAELDRELEAMKAAGFGGAEQVLLRNPNDWWTPAFRASTRHAVEKATSLGLRFDTTLGPEWPMSSKAVDDVSKGLSLQEAIFSAIEITGPTTYTGPLPQIDDNLLRRRELIAVTAAKPVNQAAALPVKGLPPVVLDQNTAVDLTPRVKDGTLTWQVPAGRWTLVATWMRPTGSRPHGDAVTLVGGFAEQNLPLTLPDLGGLFGPLVPDHFSRAAIDATLRDYDDTLFGGDMAAVLRRNGGHVFEDSLELDHSGAPGTPLTNFPDGCAVCTAQFWTPAFLDEFRKRRGYDLTPLLPAIFASFGLADGGADRVRADYYRTLSDLLVDNHYAVIRKWANAHGLKSRAQGYNLVGTDKTHLSSKLQLPDGESLDFADLGDAVAPGSATANKVIDDYRQIVSGAHLSGATEISDEAGANLFGEYDMSVDDYKAIADRAFAAGVTTMVLHGFAYRTYRDVYQAWTWPGWSAFNILFAESWNQTHPAFALWNGLAGYYGRISAALQTGKPRVDVTVLSTQSTPHAYGSADVAGALRASDYTWDRIDDTSLGGLPPAENGRILPTGPGYRAVVVDNLAQISEASAAKLLAFARRGVAVVIKGDVPSHGTSHRAPQAEDAAVRAAFAALLKRADVRRVRSGREVVTALAELGVPADLRRPSSSVVAQHRRTKAGDVWFLYNNSTKRLAEKMTFATRGTPSRIDPWTGVVTHLGAYRIGRHATTVPVAMAAGETALIAFDRTRTRALHATTADGEVIRTGRSVVLRDTSGGPHRARLSDGRRRTVSLPGLDAPMNVTGPWSLSVRTVGPTGDGTVAMTLDGLREWRDIPALSGASGTGVYSAKVTLPAGWLARNRGVMIDPGTIGGFVRLKVNGRTVPAAALSDGPRDVTALLKPGVNELEATVATTVTNRTIGLGQGGDVRYAFFLKNAKQAYGLIGPVRLVPFGRATLATTPRR